MFNIVKAYMIIIHDTKAYIYVKGKHDCIAKCYLIMGIIQLQKSMLGGGGKDSSDKQPKVSFLPEVKLIFFCHLQLELGIQNY